MFEYVHHQLARVGVGDAQFVAAVLQHLALLLRMPLLFRHPAGTLLGEAQQGGVFGLACKYAVAGGEVRIQLFFGDVLRCLIQ